MKVKKLCPFMRGANRGFDEHHVTNIIKYGDQKNHDFCHIIQFQLNSIPFHFPSKYQTHLKNTQDGEDATKSKSLKRCN